MSIRHLKNSGLATVLFLLIGTAFLQRSGQSISGLLWGWQEVFPVNQSVDLYELSVNFGVYDPTQKFAGSPLFAFEHIFISWLDENPALITASTKYASDRNRWVMATIEPWNREESDSSAETLFADIRAGAYDREIERVCTVLADQDRPIFIRWGHEMDVVTGRYPWAQFDADGFVESYRHFVSKCRAIVPDSWYIWSPVSDGQEMHRYWPGEQFVDRIGLPVFGFPERDLDLFGRLRTFTDIFDEKYQRVSIYQKQIMVAELGVAGEPNYQKRWMLQLFRAVEDYPLLTSVVYFDSKDNFGAWERKYSVPDWRISHNLFE